MTETILLDGLTFSIVHCPRSIRYDVFAEDVKIGELGGFSMVYAYANNGNFRAFHPGLRSKADVVRWLWREYCGLNIDLLEVA